MILNDWGNSLMGVYKAINWEHMVVPCYLQTVILIYFLGANVFMTYYDYPNYTSLQPGTTHLARCNLNMLTITSTFVTAQAFAQERKNNGHPKIRDFNALRDIIISHSRFTIINSLCKVIGIFLMMFFRTTSNGIFHYALILFLISSIILSYPELRLKLLRILRITNTVFGRNWMMPRIPSRGVTYGTVSSRDFNTSLGEVWDVMGDVQHGRQRRAFMNSVGISNEDKPDDNLEMVALGDASLHM
ncbi:Protein CBG27637 [Caenorhabditis briggsae]|uniref:Protein CBG27637 n=1 Tax=Caenorhabditis briggsae TaxID=6238 RepID=B6IJ82_CAEBR|nr:Protein CBG27637 [Caenorhabditis briggsae]CAR99916.1 Protein CBG27637 [Caenorhabditis briggsae]